MMKVMKSNVLLLAVIFCLVAGCDENKGDENIGDEPIACTEVFVSISIELKYPDGQPVLLDSSKVLWVSENRYEEIDSVSWNGLRLFGHYLLVNDNMREELEGRQESIYFTGYLNGKTVIEKNLLVGADRCHVQHLDDQPLTYIITPDGDVSVDPFPQFTTFSTIAFMARFAQDSGAWSLCAMDTSGANMRKIVDLKIGFQKPVLSRSGTKLLFIAVDNMQWNDPDGSFHASMQSDLYMVNTDGTGLALIDRVGHTDDGGIGNFAWAPDDQHVLYVRSYDNYWNESSLIRYRIADKTQSVLSTDDGYISNPAFSPNGTQLIYGVSDGINQHINTMNANGGNKRLLISNANYPKWSPRGDKIAYITTGKDRSSQISVADADGKNQKQLTSSVSSVWRDTGYPRGGNGDPQWTPDGNSIVYVSEENDRFEIFIMKVDGSEQTRLTIATIRDEYPEITPDGKNILFTSVREGMAGGVNPGICIMTVDGKDQRVLSQTGIYPVVCK
ncbi:MAG: hypothetical protein LBE56_09155 [Tannerella sp.]|nr:hypothetical protein [Tannerella sp.]